MANIKTRKNGSNIQRAVSFIPNEDDIQRLRSYTHASEVPTMDWLRIGHRHIALALGNKDVPGGVERLTLENDKSPIFRIVMFSGYAPTCQETLPTIFDPNMSAQVIAASYLASKDSNPDRYLEGFEMICSDVTKGYKYLVCVNRANIGKDIHEAYDDFDMLVLDTDQDRFVDLKKEFGYLYL